MPRSQYLKRVKTIVVKVGSSLITNSNGISAECVDKLVDDVVFLIKKKYKVVIVSSGAISAGSAVMKKKRMQCTIPEKQALAAIGQSILMDVYRGCFNKRGYEVGQILLTEDDVKHRRRFLNARHTLNALLDMGVVPIVNENDSVVIKEIKFGDNDTLSAHVANIVQADLLILLSDIDGFYWDEHDEEPVSEIIEINDEVRKRCRGAGSEHGTGGMVTKIKAGEIVIKSGEMMIIANGKTENILKRILQGEKIGTLFSGKTQLKSKKRWLAFNVKSKGKLTIDGGAVKALKENKKSLLAIGITNIEGSFDLGDAVEIVDTKGTIIGKGIVNYTSDELHKIKGKNTQEIKKIFGSKYYEEVINRDDLIMF
ncbi:MAG TPA: glutamate 5-kinase [Spirochaetota bacterium]|nr:glutamate 5-kinase [Spirochaetota bacterium]